jgi:hypothetical protein
VSESTIVNMLFGSHVYGTSTPDSDRDYKRIFVPRAKDIVLQRATKTSRNRSTGDPHGKNGAGDVDVEEFSLHGYLKLLCDGQTVAVDMLFVPPKFVESGSSTWDFIVNNRHVLISKSIAPFVGYVRSQANKYGIKGSRMAAAKAAAELLRRAAGRVPKARLGDFEPLLVGLATEHEHVCWINRKHPKQDRTELHLSVCGKLAPMSLRIDRAAEMYEALWVRYGERSRAAMNNEGIDWKALMHAVRICDQAHELLATGHVTFPRPNAADLLAIRLGKRPYAEVAEQIEVGMQTLEYYMKESKLRAQPDRKWAEALIGLEYGAQIRANTEW